jgi:hypothetical protein
VRETCPCGDPDCWHFPMGYPLCRPCDEHHRPPECAVDEHGQSLMPCGHPWTDDPGCLTCVPAKTVPQE